MSAAFPRNPAVLPGHQYNLETEALTWSGAMNTLASGAISGGGSWAAGRILEQLFPSSGDSLRLILEEFTEQIVAELTEAFRSELASEMANHEVRQTIEHIESNTRDVILSLRGEATNLPTTELLLIVLGPQGIPAIISDSSSRHVRIASFGSFFLMVGLYAAVQSLLAQRDSPDSSVTTEMWRIGKLRQINGTIDEAWDHLRRVHLDLYRMAQDAVEIREGTFLGVFLVAVDGVVRTDGSGAFRSRSDAERAAVIERTALHRAIVESMITPAALALRTLKQSLDRLAVQLSGRGAAWLEE